VIDNAGEFLRIPRQSVPMAWIVLALRVPFISNHWLRIRHAAMKLFDAGPLVFINKVGLFSLLLKAHKVIIVSLFVRGLYTLPTFFRESLFG
jgi:hypothetical protein